MSDTDYLEDLFDLLRSYAQGLGSEHDRKFHFRREALKRRPKIDPAIVDHFIDTHDFS